MKSWSFPALAGLLLLTAACTTNQINVTADAARPAPRDYAMVVVGEVLSDLSAAELLTPRIRAGLVKELREDGRLLHVMDGRAMDPPPEALVVTGEITGVDYGNSTARFLVGFGAGAQSISGTFRLAEADGTPLATFSSSESYAGGAGIGGISHLGMEDVADRFGKSVAEAIRRWLRGEPLKRTDQNQD